MFNNVVLGVEERRAVRAGRRGGPSVPGVAPVAAAPPPVPTPVPAPPQPTSPTPAPTPTPAPVPPPGETREKRQREDCCPIYQGGRAEKRRRLEIQQQWSQAAPLPAVPQQRPPPPPPLPPRMWTSWWPLIGLELLQKLDKLCQGQQQQLQQGLPLGQG